MPRCASSYKPTGAGIIQSQSQRLVQHSRAEKVKILREGGKVFHWVEHDDPHGDPDNRPDSDADPENAFNGSKCLNGTVLEEHLPNDSNIFVSKT